MRKRKNYASLTRQVQEALEAKICVGESKYAAKKAGTAQNGIYSWNTFKTYMKHLNYFADYCKVEHGCKTLADCRQYASEWMSSRSELSAYTQKLEAAALGKLYGCKSSDFGSTASRSRAAITRSRGAAARDAHFSEEKHADFVDFCRSTGLRRSELKNLMGDHLIYKDGKPYIAITGKGGRYREAPVIGNVSNVEHLCHAAGTGHVFGAEAPGGIVYGGADIHSYRADYATAIYNSHAREISSIPVDSVNHGIGWEYQSDAYYCRGDLAGVKLDRAAMMEASAALGHSRVSVVAGHYIRGLK